MSDLINRQAALKACDNSTFAAEAKWVIEHLPSMENTGKWIPCTERLPEEDGLFLVTHAYKHGNTNIAVNRVKIMLFWAKSKSWQVDGITAWMPLPEPYREVE